jgi:hypothetical protein
MLIPKKRKEERKKERKKERKIGLRIELEPIGNGTCSDGGTALHCACIRRKYHVEMA